MDTDDDASLPPEGHEVTFPRVYRPTSKQRGMTYLFGVLGVAMGVGFIVAAVLLRGQRDARLLFGILVPIGLAFALYSAHSIAAIRRSCVVLFEDAIEIVALGYSRRRLARDEIRGIRILPMKYGFRQFVFESRDPGRKPIKDYLYVEHDEVLDDWLGSLPNLDAIEQERAIQELLARPELGKDEEERARSFRTAFLVSRATTVVALLAGAWLAFYPRWPWIPLATLAALPLVALALLLGGKGRYATVDDRNDPRPSLLIPLFGPGAVLVLRALVDIHVIEWPRLAAWAALLALPLVALVTVGDPLARRRWFIPLGIWFFLSAYPAGALWIANAVFDRHPAENVRLSVLDKHVSSGKGPKHHVHVAPWIPGAPESIDVHRALYGSVVAGGTICVKLRPGALGVRWFYPQACGESAGRKAGR